MNVAVVTGASGFVGSAVIRKLLEENIKVIALDKNQPTADRRFNHSNYSFFECDVFDLEQVKTICEQYDFDTFYHFAWIGSAGTLRSDYNVQIKNAISTVELMKLAKSLNCNRFIVSGTIMEYETFEAIYAQNNKPNTAYIYGVGKLLAHSICKPTANEIGIELIWAYITNTYGVGESSPRLINSTIRKCIRGEVLEFTAATQIYDFIYIDDVANAFYLIGENGKPNKGYIIGSGKTTNLKSFLSIIVEVCNNKLEPHFGSVPFTGIDLPVEYFSISEIESDCGFIPMVSFEEGIKKTFEWIKEVDNK